MYDLINHYHAGIEKYFFLREQWENAPRSERKRLYYQLIDQSRYNMMVDEVITNLKGK